MSTFLIANLLFSMLVKPADILPTISNSTGDYYINSASTPNNFQFDTITCSTDHCHIICDTISGCYTTTINATTASTLTIECIEVNSCSDSIIIGALLTNIIHCKNKNACHQSNILTNAITTNLECSNTETSQSYTDAACKSTNLIANHNSNEINIFCNNYDCYNASFYVKTADIINIELQQYAGYEMSVYASDITTALNVNCQSKYGCYESNIYCPLQAACNINCFSSSTCFNTNIFISNHQYDKLTLNCNNSLNNSCISSTLNCMNTDGITEWMYSESNGEWKCDNYECCPYSDGIISCEIAQDCVINCTSTICANKNKNAVNATSLELYCESSDCQGSYIQCPNEGSCDIICSEYDSCSYSIIHVSHQSNSNEINEFNLECCGVSSCEYSEILISSMQNTTITCTQVDSCRNINISFWDSLSLSTYALANMFSLSCLSTTSCKSLNLNMGYDNFISSVNLICEGNRSCNALLLTGENSAISSLDIDCIGSDVNACKELDIFAVIDNSVDINCGYASACTGASFVLDVKQSVAVAAGISCSNQYITNEEDMAACYEAQFNFIQNLEDNDNTLVITCNKYDCFNAVFNTASMNNVQIFCDSPYSCHKTTINATESKSLIMECQSDNSCFQATIFCPYKQLNGCIINCKEYDNVCNSMTIHVPHDSTNDINGKGYMHNYLELTCPSFDLYNTPCDDVYFDCFTSYINDYVRGIELYYDAEQSKYFCSNYELNYCCPWLYGGTVSCEADTNCRINCESNINCHNAYINGTLSKTLIVNCIEDCSDSIILCPNGGCTVNCIGQSSCHRTEIKYDGIISDAASVILNCTGGYECESTKIYAINAAIIFVDARYRTQVSIHGEYADQITVLCGGLGTDNNYRTPGGLGCQNVDIYGTYANNINVTIKNSYGFYKSRIHGQYAKSVTIDVINGYAFYESSLLFHETELVNINCISNCRFNNDYAGKDKCKPYGNACWKGMWYLSSKNNVNINCYGWGCGYTGIEITPTNDALQLLSNMNINANGCGMCDSMNECVAGWNIWCENQWNEYERIRIPDCTDVNPWQYSTGDYNTYPVDCGCENVVTNSINNYVNDENHEKCILREMGSTGSTTDVAMKCTVFMVFSITFINFVLCTM